MSTKAERNYPDVHPDDGDLIRLLDDELLSAEATRLRSHVDGCDTCRARLRGLTRRSERVTALLRSSGDAVPPAPYVDDGAVSEIEPIDVGRAASAKSNAPADKWLRAAAVLALLLAGGLFAPPVRAWVTDRVEAAAAWFGDPAPVPASIGGTTLRVPARGPAITVHMVRPADGAVLLLRRAGGDAAVLEVPAPGGEVLLLPGGFQIQDAPAGTVYQLGLPVSVRRVQLRVDAAPLVEIPVPDEGQVEIPMTEALR